MRSNAISFATCHLGFPEIVRRAIANENLEWKSRILRGTDIATSSDPSDHILRILNDVCEPNSTLSRQVRHYVTKAGGIGSASLHSTQVLTQDKLLAFADEYRELMQRADDLLPKSGRILDADAGTLNFSVFLAAQSPRRQLIAVGSNPSALHIGERKLRIFLESDSISPHHIFCQSSASTRLPLGRASAAISCRIFASQFGRKETLRMIQRNLDTRGLLFFIEATPQVKNRERVKRLLLRLALSAVKNHSPLTDFDLALLAAISVRRMARESNDGRASFLGRTRLCYLLQSVGFRIISAVPVLQRMATLVVAEKL